VADVAKALGCDRASLGLLAGFPARLVAMSHQGETRFKGRLADDLFGAMEEAIDQARPSRCPSRPAACPASRCPTNACWPTAAAASSPCLFALAMRASAR
jgi:hypothetical protein